MRIGPVRRGATDALPLIVSYLPFGLVLGTTVAVSSVPSFAGWATSPALFAGAAQLALIDLTDAGAPAAVIVATVWVINQRHVMYSGALAPWFRQEPMWWQIVAPYFLADPIYTFSAVRFPDYALPADRRRYYAALSVTLWSAWLAMTAAGVLLGTTLPDEWPLELAVPLVFLALLAPTVADRPTRLAAVAGAAVTVTAHQVPLHLGLIIGAIAGVSAGLIAESVASRKEPVA